MTWKIVPVEPTEEMADAAIENLGSRAAWDAMLAAAPKPSEDEALVEKVARVIDPHAWEVWSTPIYSERLGLDQQRVRQKLSVNAARAVLKALEGP